MSDIPCGRTMNPDKNYHLPRINGNQKAIRIKKAISNRDHPYSLFNIEALKYASVNLSPNGFKMWAILNSNKDNYELALSPDLFKGAMGRTAYMRVVNELIEKGFLRKAGLYPNFQGYIFVEGGDQEETTYTEEINLAFIDRNK